MTLAIMLLWAGRRRGQGGAGPEPGHEGDGDRDRGSTTGAGVPTPPGALPAPKEVEVWLRGGDRIELDGAAADLETTLIRARAVGRVRVRASGDARVGWSGKVIHELRAAQVTVLADASLLWDADHVHADAEASAGAAAPRNAAARQPSALPRYSARRGRWSGGDSRTLYAFTSVATGRTWVVPGGYDMHWGPDATVRVATRDEAEELWQRPLHPGWTVAAPPRNAAEPTHIAVLRRMGDELFATKPLNGDGVTVLQTSTSVQGAIASAPARGDLQIRGEYTSDGSRWGLGRGRLVARREHGRWLVG